MQFPALPANRTYPTVPLSSSINPSYPQKIPKKNLASASVRLIARRGAPRTIRRPAWSCTIGPRRQTPAIASSCSAPVAAPQAVPRATHEDVPRDATLTPMRPRNRHPATMRDKDRDIWRPIRYHVLQKLLSSFVFNNLRFRACRSRRRPARRACNRRKVGRPRGPALARLIAFRTPAMK